MPVASTSTLPRPSQQSSSATAGPSTQRTPQPAVVPPAASLDTYQRSLTLLKQTQSLKPPVLSNFKHQMVEKSKDTSLVISYGAHAAVQIVNGAQWIEETLSNLWYFCLSVAQTVPVLGKSIASEDSGQAELNRFKGMIDSIPKNLTTLEICAEAAKGLNTAKDMLVVDNQEISQKVENIQKMLASQMSTLLLDKYRETVPPPPVDFFDKLPILTKVLVRHANQDNDNFPHVYHYLVALYGDYDDIMKILNTMSGRAAKFESNSSDTYDQCQLTVQSLIAGTPKEGLNHHRFLRTLSYLALSSGGLIAAIPGAGSALAAIGGATLGNVVGSPAGFNVISSVTTGLLKGLGQTNTDDNASKAKFWKFIHAFLVADTHERQEILPRTVKERIRSLDRTVETAIRDYQFDELETLLLRRQSVYIRFPQSTKRLPPSSIHHQKAFSNLSHHSKEFSEKLDESINVLLTEYSYVPNLESIIKDVRYSSYKSGSKERKQLLLVGPPGVGKSRFARRLAQALELHFEEISLSEPAFKNFMGDPMQRQMGAVLGDKRFGDRELLTDIPFAMTHCGYTNPILLFDEVGTHMDRQENPMHQPNIGLSPLKTFFDPAKASINAVSVGNSISYDFQSATIIFTANREPTDDAMKSRLEIIKFPEIGREKRMEIIRFHFLKECEAQARIGAADRAKMIAAVEQYLGRIADVQIRHQIAGVRGSGKLASKLCQIAEEEFNNDRALTWEAIQDAVELNAATCNSRTS